MHYAHYNEYSKSLRDFGAGFALIAYVSSPSGHLNALIS